MSTTKTKTMRENPIPRYSDENPDTMTASSSSSTINPGSINDMHLYHQITHLNFCYFESAWAYTGTTTLYLTYTWVDDEDTKIHSTDSNQQDDNHRITNIRFHFRGGSKMKITNVQMATIQNQTRIIDSNHDVMINQQQQEEEQDDNDDEPQLIHVPIVNIYHVDPLAKVLTKPYQTLTPLDFMNEEDSTYLEYNSQSFTHDHHHQQQQDKSKRKKRRYEADTQYIRGGQGMMDALRCKSIASNLGEVQISFVRPNSNNIDDKKKNIQRNSEEWNHKVYHCWKKDIDDSSLGKGNNNHTSSSLHQELKQRLNERHAKRREKRINFIAKQLQESSSSQKQGTEEFGRSNRKQLALKVTIHFKMFTHPCGSIHLGGIHFLSPLLSKHGSISSSNSNTNINIPRFMTPHVYTTTGTVGDHQGPRCWLPTIDSARWNHRCTHEMSIVVTAKKEEGLWATGFGEDFGMNDVIIHPVPSSSSTTVTTSTTSQESDLNSSLIEILGQEQVSLIIEALHSSVQDDDSHQPHVPILATAMWVSSLWNPAPARSLGFAIAPFRIVYDHEYYTKLEDHDEDEEYRDRKRIDKHRVFVAFKAAVRRGEGVRQLYFADPQERISIQKGRILLKTNDNFKLLGGKKYGSSSFLSESSLFGPLNAIQRAIVASTDGVPMRALSLMRGILSIPRFRTSSHTQIWIPGAVDGGSSSGALCTHPEIVCNAFIGGAIFDSSLLHPPNLRLPYYFGGRTCQFLQAQSAIRGWIIATTPLAGDDDIGQSYIHVLFECLLMSFYERAHGSFGEGGGKKSYFYCKRFASKSGFNSPNIDFLPIYNIEDEYFGVGGYHGTQGGEFS